MQFNHEKTDTGKKIWMGVYFSSQGKHKRPCGLCSVVYRPPWGCRDMQNHSNWLIFREKCLTKCFTFSPIVNNGNVVWIKYAAAYPSRFGVLHVSFMPFMITFDVCGWKDRSQWQNKCICSIVWHWLWTYSAIHRKRVQKKSWKFVFSIPTISHRR